MPNIGDSVFVEPLLIGVLTNSTELVDADYSIDLATMNISYNELTALFFPNASRHFSVSRNSGLNKFLSFAKKNQVDNNGASIPFNLLDFVVQKIAEKRSIPSSAISSNSIIASTKAALKYNSLVQFDGHQKALTLYEVIEMLISNNTIVASQNSTDEAQVCLILKALYQDISSNLTVGVNFYFGVKIPGYKNSNTAADVAGPEDAKSEGKEEDHAKGEGKEEDDDNNVGGSNSEEKPNEDKKKVKEEAEIPMKVAKKITEEDMDKENVFFKQEEDDNDDDDDNEDEYFENPKKPHYSRDEKNYYDKSTPEKEPSVRFFNLKEKNNNESDKLVNSILHQIMSLNDEDNEENDDEIMDFQNDEDTIAGWSNN